METCFGAWPDVCVQELNVYLAQLLSSYRGAGRIYAASPRCCNEGTGGAIALATGVVPLGAWGEFSFTPQGCLLYTF